MSNSRELRKIVMESNQRRILDQLEHIDEAIQNLAEKIRRQTELAKENPDELTFRVTQIVHLLMWAVPNLSIDSLLSTVAEYEKSKVWYEVTNE